MKLTNEQLGQIGKSLLESGYKGRAGDEYRIHLGTVAVAAVAPLLLERPSEQELAACFVSDEYGGHDGCVTKAFSNRLASVTAKPDPNPAVEAAWQKMRMHDGWPHIDSKDSKRLLARAREIVAAVDAARAK